MSARKRFFSRSTAGFLVIAGFVTGCAPLADYMAPPDPFSAGSKLGELSGRGKPREGAPDYTAQLTQAQLLEKSGKLEEARDIYEKLIRRFPDRAEPLHRLGVVADRQKRHREAQSHFTRAIQIEPTNAEALNDLGYCLLLQGKLAKAERALLKSVRLDELRRRSWNNLGIVFGQQRRYDEALDAFRRTGSEADAYYNLAFVFASQNEADAAVECFRYALAEDPTHADARKALASFKQYEKRPVALASFEGTMPLDDNLQPYYEGTSGHSGITSGARESAGQPRNSSASGDASEPQPRRLPSSADAGSATRALHESVRKQVQERREAR